MGAEFFFLFWARQWEFGRQATMIDECGQSWTCVRFGELERVKHSRTNADICFAMLCYDIRANNLSISHVRIVLCLLS